MTGLPDLRKTLLLVLAAISFANSATATPTALGPWLGTTDRNNSIAQFNKDLTSCQAIARKKYPVFENPKNAGLAPLYLRLMSDYVMHECMPKRGWRWTGA